MDGVEAKVFLGSSQEAKPYAVAIQDILFSLDGRVTAWWSDGAFPVGSTFIESLVALTTITNSSLLIASEDDSVTVRGEQTFVPRDNVIFEHGVFTGAHGRARSAVAVLGNPKLPSDLLGVVIIKLHKSSSIGEFKERNRDIIRMCFETLTRSKPTIEFKTLGIREPVNHFMQEMDQIWSEFDNCWNHIHLQNHHAEARFAHVLDEFFQQYHRFFDAVRTNDSLPPDLFRAETIRQANQCLLKAWEHVAEGKMSLAEDDEKDPALRATRRRFRGIKDGAALRLREGRNAKLSIDKRLDLLKTSVQLTEDFLKKTVTEV